MVNFPAPVYPLELDSDYTLFNVHNSTQSVLTKQLEENDTVIEILPVTANDPDVFPENGFVTINQEIIYYDKTIKDNNGKACKLTNCIRGFEVSPKKHRKGSAVYGFIVAQHHNQLVDAIIAIENTIGNLQSFQEPSRNFELLSLHQAVNSLASAPPVSDDACPDVQFIFNVLSTGPTVAEYCVRIYGSYNTYRLDFGDGTYTENTFVGTHTYSGSVDPVVTVTSDSCSITQRPISSEDSPFVPDLPEPSVPFAIQIPEIPDFPSFIAPLSTKTCPGPLFNLPPLIIPELTCSNTSPCNVSVTIEGFDIPSAISLEGCCIPSVISVECCEFPSFISIVGSVPSEISLVGPSSISLVIDVPSIISFECCDIPSVISFSPFPPISFTSPPTISVDWGIPPIVSVSIICNTTTATNFIDDSEFLGMNDNIEVTYEDIGIPREINLVHNLPNVIRIPDVKFVNPEVKVIDTLPDSIYINASEMPRTIKYEGPETISLKLDDNFPKFFELKATGIPDKIEVVGIPETIEVQMIMPENPVVEMVYKGSPIELNVNVDLAKNLSDIILVKK